jgi:hypothetical protein
VNPEEWTRIVARIQGAYQREVTPETAAAWWDELRGFTAEEVLDAVRRCIREHQYLTVAHIYKAIDANHKQERDERERYESQVRQRVMAGKKGTPAPPEFKKALRVYADPTSVRDGRLTDEAKAEIYALGDRIMDRGPAWVPRELTDIRDPSGED